MREPEMNAFEDTLEYVPLSSWDVDVPVDILPPQEDDDESDLGIRSLYENPELIVPPSRWPLDAA